MSFGFGWPWLSGCSFSVQHWNERIVFFHCTSWRIVLWTRWHMLLDLETKVGSWLISVLHFSANIIPHFHALSHSSKKNISWLQMFSEFVTIISYYYTHKYGHMQKQIIMFTKERHPAVTFVDVAWCGNLCGCGSIDNVLICWKCVSDQQQQLCRFTSRDLPPSASLREFDQSKTQEPNLLVFRESFLLPSLVFFVQNWLQALPECKATLKVPEIKIR